MNRSALKTYAPKARLDFIRAVTDRAAFFGLTPGRTEPMTVTGDVVIIGGRAFPKIVAQQRKSLEERIQRQGFEQVVEAMAYTWFNRFVALRYMELHGYLDHGHRVLSSAPGPDPDSTTAIRRADDAASLRDLRASVVKTPEILDHAEHVTLPGLDPQQVIQLKLDGSREAELYRLLLVAQCNALHEAMPFLFEKVADDTELLLADNLLHSDSLIRKLVGDIEEADWEQVEIIGWLYQFYISDKKDAVIGKVVKSEDIPAATQLFTPNWIVKYLVQNTLGRQWLATYPESPLRQQMEYYIEPAEQTDEVKAQLAAITPKSLDPEALTLLDPATGSGHILVEAYDLFKAIYQERGYRSKDIPRLILQKNLFGLEIDDRAAQLAAFALLMKARADDRRIFADRIQPNVVAIQESKGLEGLLTPDPTAASVAGDLPLADSDLFPDTQKQLTLNKPAKGSPLAAVQPCLHELIKLFEHGKTFGSLINVPPSLAIQLQAARQHIEAMLTTGQLWENRAGMRLLPLVKQGELLARTYYAVVTNPPYMGDGYFTPLLRQYVGKYYRDAKTDLYACFIQRNIVSVRPNGFIGMITIPNWMFLSSFSDLRRSVLDHSTIDTLVHNGRGVWGSDFGSCSFVIRHTDVGAYRAVYKRLFTQKGSVAPLEELRQRFFETEPFTANKSAFTTIPGAPLAYWVTGDVLVHFVSTGKLRDAAEARRGLQTGNGPRFIRYWYEVDAARTLLAEASRDECLQSACRWFLLNNGGDFRKWSGNIDYVVNWAHNGADIKNSGKAIIPSEHRYFEDAITWSRVSAATTAFRYVRKGIIPGDSGPCIFGSADLWGLLGYLNSPVARHFLEVLVPTLTFLTGDIESLPVLDAGHSAYAQCSPLVQECVRLADGDWCGLESSWGFSRFPLIDSRWDGKDVQEAWTAWSSLRDASFLTMKNLEEEVNRIFISAFRLQAELSFEVPQDEITLTHAERERDMRRLLSYAIGCMMGRYSLDKPGLVYAHSRNEGFDPTQYSTFPADLDGIIPVTEMAWFPDDAAERFAEFISKAWPREHLEENLKFIADSLGPNREEHPRDTIRRYLATVFYKAHLQMYKKRPIYWLFSSGKQRAFQCLVYLHRYHEGTMARMRTEYVIPLQGKVSHRIDQLAEDSVAATSTSHRRKLEKERETLVKQRTELAAFDEKLRHFADQRIALDLDDGVKVNYGKFGDLLAEVKAVTGGGEE